MTAPRYWFVVPAAGVGARMQAQRPKQYLTVAGKTILEHTLERLLQVPDVAGIAVCVSPEDAYFDGLAVANSPLIHRVDGGDLRCDSVLNGLVYLQDKVAVNDWVLVHDAARPCVYLSDISKLIDHCESLANGGLLGVPVSDTIKRVGKDLSVEQTVDRSILWQAQTPQMFRYGELKQALEQALANNISITDEASAMEALGQAPAMVEASRNNIKVTRPEDLAVVELILTTQNT